MKASFLDGERDDFGKLNWTLVYMNQICLLYDTVCVVYYMYFEYVFAFVYDVCVHIAYIDNSLY